MDGSVSTLAPLFATAFATRDPRITFLVGLAAAVGAGISMGFSEGLSDDGSLTGRGSPHVRGAITGLATFVGGILHTLPFLIPHVNLALYVAFGVVGLELLAISFIRYRYFDMSFLMSADASHPRRCARLHLGYSDRQRISGLREMTALSAVSFHFLFGLRRNASALDRGRWPLVGADFQPLQTN